MIDQSKIKKMELDTSNESQKGKNTSVWLEEDEVKLFNLFEKEGSKWTSIS